MFFLFQPKLKKVQNRLETFLISTLSHKTKTLQIIENGISKLHRTYNVIEIHYYILQVKMN